MAQKVVRGEGVFKLNYPPLTELKGINLNYVFNHIHLLPYQFHLVYILLKIFELNLEMIVPPISFLQAKVMKS